MVQACTQNEEWQAALRRKYSWLAMKKNESESICAEFHFRRLFPPCERDIFVFNLLIEPNIWLCDYFPLNWTFTNIYVFNFLEVSWDLRHSRTVNIYFWDEEPFAASHFILFIPCHEKLEFLFMAWPLSDVKWPNTSKARLSNNTA